MSKNKPDHATVDDLIEILEKSKAMGFGSYVVTCNNEYTLARKKDAPVFNHAEHTADLGGYDS